MLKRTFYIILGIFLTVDGAFSHPDLQEIQEHEIRQMQICQDQNAEGFTSFLTQRARQSYSSFQEVALFEVEKSGFNPRNNKTKPAKSSNKKEVIPLSQDDNLFNDGQQQITFHENLQEDLSDDCDENQLPESLRTLLAQIPIQQPEQGREILKKIRDALMNIDLTDSEQLITYNTLLSVLNKRYKISLQIYSLYARDTFVQKLRKFTSINEWRNLMNNAPYLFDVLQTESFQPSSATHPHVYPVTQMVLNDFAILCLKELQDKERRTKFVLTLKTEPILWKYLARILSQKKLKTLENDHEYSKIYEQGKKKAKSIKRRLIQLAQKFEEDGTIEQLRAQEKESLWAYLVKHGFVSIKRVKNIYSIGKGLILDKNTPQ